MSGGVRSRPRRWRFLEPLGVGGVEELHRELRLFAGHASELGAEREEIDLGLGEHAVGVGSSLVARARPIVAFSSSTVP